MITKRGVIVLLFIIALILALFSLTATFYINTDGVNGGTTDRNFGGNVGLVVLPQENSSSISAAT